ncbi:MAG: hypothetical protein ACO2ZZ_11145 [Cyclobacteriaceae bacterium]|jgi:hypothetical protein
MRRFLISCFCLVFTILLSAQSSDRYKTWKVLEGISYEKSEDEYGEIYVPVFSKEVRALEGMEISLPGYIIPFEGMFKPDRLIISSLPIASCFFCGSGGPETVAEVEMKDPVKYTAKLVEITGILELNDNDTDQLMYIVKNATLKID